jgi:hypothetical protein
MTGLRSYKMQYSIELFFSLFSSANRIELFVYGEWHSFSKAMFKRLNNVSFIFAGSEWIKTKDSITKKG